MQKAKAYYHSRERFGTVDGRGIRYVLFLAGCQLGCKFCHNPDTWQQGSQTITVDEVLADFARYRAFYERSGGGLTVSGGEPLLQADFVRELFHACREQKIHTTLDTSGHCSQESLAAVLPYTDAVLFSIKAAGHELHRELTCSDNDHILSNLQFAAAKLPVTVRYVVIPGVTTEEAEISELAALIKSFPASALVELLPYHTFGRSKWEKLGWRYQLGGIPAAGKQDVQKVEKLLKQQGVVVLSGD